MSLTKKRNSLTFLIVFLVASAATRLASNATEMTTTPPSNDTSRQETNEALPTDEVMSALFKDVLAREKKVTEREQNLKDQIQELEGLRLELEDRIARLEQAEEQLRDTIALADTAAENDLTQLTNVYERMKPKTASAVFAEMDAEFAAGFLSRMRADSAASIMAGLNPDQAYAISVILAGRNANVPTFSD